MESILKSEPQAPCYVCGVCGQLGTMASFNKPPECQPGWTHGRLIKVDRERSARVARVAVVPLSAEDSP